MGGTLEVIDFEDRSTGLRGRTLKLRTVDFHESFGGQELPEKVSDRSLDLEDRLVRLCPEVDDTVVEPRIEQNAVELLLRGLDLLLWTVGVLNSKRESCLQARDQVNLAELMSRALLQPRREITCEIRTSTSDTLALLIGSGDFWTIPSTSTMLSIARPAAHLAICLLTFPGETVKRACTESVLCLRLRKTILFP